MSNVLAKDKRYSDTVSKRRLITKSDNSGIHKLFNRASRRRMCVGETSKEAIEDAKVQSGYEEKA